MHEEEEEMMDLQRDAHDSGISNVLILQQRRLQLGWGYLERIHLDEFLDGRVSSILCQALGSI